MSKLISSIANRFSDWLELIAGTALTVVMLLIGFDIVGRIFGHPVPGTYEIVSLAGGLVIGMALPATSRAGGHVSTDILLNRLSENTRKVFTICTRLIGMGIFLFAGYGLVLMGLRLKESGEVTAVLSFPFYYATFAIGGAFLVQVLVLFSEMLETLKLKS